MGKNTDGHQALNGPRRSATPPHPHPPTQRGAAGGLGSPGPPAGVPDTSRGPESDLVRGLARVFAVQLRLRSAAVCPRRGCLLDVCREATSAGGLAIGPTMMRRLAVDPGALITAPNRSRPYCPPLDCISLTFGCALSGVPGQVITDVPANGSSRQEKQAARGPLNHLTSKAICQLEGGDVEHLESAREQRCTAVAWPTQKRRPCSSPRPPVGCFGPSSNTFRLRNWTPPCWRDQNNCATFRRLCRSLSKWQQLSNGFNLAGCQKRGLSPGVGVSAAFIC